MCTIHISSCCTAGITILLVCQPRSEGYSYGNLYTWLLANTSVVVLIINSRQYPKKYKLTSLVAQIDWKISQVEAVQFCCRTATCKNKVNYFNCVSHDNNNQSKNPHHCLFQFLSYLLIAIVLTSVCTGNFTYVHGKLVIFFRKWNYALDTILHPPIPITFTHPSAR